MKNRNFSIRQRIKSFAYAFNGVKIFIQEEHNARIHLFVTICVLAASFIFKISLPEWIAVIFAIGFVITSEVINTALENIADFVSPEKNEQIKKVKDLAAAGVLICSITALSIGLIIFIPKIIALC